MIVLDTNVLSETLRPSPSAVVLRWLAAQERLAVFMTVITQAEVLYGVESLPAGKRRDRLSAAIGRILVDEFPGRILPFDEDAANVYPKIVARREAMGRPISQFDAMIASIALSRRAAVATRDIRDFEHCGVRIVNPWVE
jgi:predicted nucleic acid-binding protein